MALAEIIRIATAALAEEASESEDEGMESEDEGETEDEGPTPASVRGTALKIRALRDAK